MSKQNFTFIIIIAMLLPSWIQAQTYDVYPASFNSEEADFGGTFYGDQFIFSSSRQKTAITYNDDTLHQFFTDLYFTQLGSKALWQSPISLPGRVNTIMNEAQCTFSQDGKSMYYTGNLKSALSKKNDKTEKYELGIFHATLYNKEWIEDAEFTHNSVKSIFSCGHPYIANNDSLLFFSSNQPGGLGGSDIYYCNWQDNQWSQPINLGPTINTAGNEFYPFLNEYDVFYFTADTREDSEGMDIYSSTFNEGTFSDPIRLPEPINTKSDDFAYSEKKGSNKGCISSNRDSEQDDLYLFTKYEDNYHHCLTNTLPYLCYAISDENYPKIDSLPFVYEWQFSDGNTKRGKLVDHCFPGFGTFQIALNIRDTLTQNLIMIASTQELTIIEPVDPYIQLVTEWSTKQAAEIELALPKQNNIDTNTIQWFLDDEQIGKGLRLEHLAFQQGERMLTARMMTKGTKKAPAKKLCIEQFVNITGREIPILYPQYKPLILIAPDKISSPTKAQLVPKYYLSVAKSDVPLNLDDKRIVNPKYPLLEMTNQQNFIYVIEEFSDLSQLLVAYEKYKKSGLDVAIEQSLNLESVYHETRQILPTQTEQVEERIITSDITQNPQNVDLSDQEKRAIKYTAAVMNIESALQLQILNYYDKDYTLQEASAGALEIKQQLEKLLVKPSIITLITEFKSGVLPDQHHKLILQYPNTNQNNE